MFHFSDLIQVVERIQFEEKTKFEKNKVREKSNFENTKLEKKSELEEKLRVWKKIQLCKIRKGVALFILEDAGRTAISV